VLVFDASTSTIGIGATTTYGEDAEYVLGQTSFSLKSSAATQNKFGNTSGSGPTGVAYDPTSSRLFVADNNNNRVLVFDASTSTIGATTTYGENAEYVLGQTSFSLKSSAATQSRFYHPYGLSYDPASGRLFVGDVGNNRVLVFDASTSTIGATTTYGENAEYVLGQTSFSLKSSAATQSGLSGPEGVVYDHALNRLFVADYGNNRVMEYSFVTVIDPELPDGTVDVPYSVAINTTSSQGAISYSFLSGSLPAGLLFATSTGLISGTPTAAASSSFAIEVTDYLSTEGTVSNIFDYSLAINPASASVPSSDSSSSVSSGSLVSSGSSVSTGGGGSAYDLSINSGATSTASASATLSLYGTGAYTMEVAETPDFSGSAWIPYVTSMPWTLATSTGEQTVYVKYRSISGSIVGSAQASIEFAALSASTTSSTSGMSIAQMEGLLASLEAQLQALEAQAGNQTASTTASLVFTRDLQLGMTGNDVKALQQFLISQNSGSAAQKLKTHGTTTNFGTLTQNALIEFQKKAGITPTSGYFGAITRAWVNAHSQ
jgi:DNA-binding beta-propeller fold protein YncE